MIVITYIYKDTAGTHRMAESVKRQGYELGVIRTNDNPADIMRELYECYKRAVTGHDFIIYADAADTYFQKKLKVPTDHILYSTEKQCFPFPDWETRYKPVKSRWKFLNNGGICGPTKLLVEFFERYNLHTIGSTNAQAAVMEAYFKAIEEGFPIKLDTGCKQFQSVAFEAVDEFEMKDGLLRNKITKSIPAVLHGNGVTPLEKFIYLPVHNEAELQGTIDKGREAWKGVDDHVQWVRDLRSDENE